MDDDSLQKEFVHRVLEAYRKTPGTMGTVRRPDRLLAEQLYQRGVSATIVENAFVLAAARRLMRPADTPPLATSSVAGRLLWSKIHFNSVKFEFRQNL